MASFIKRDIGTLGSSEHSIPTTSTTPVSPATRESVKDQASDGSSPSSRPQLDSYKNLHNMSLTSMLDDGGVSRDASTMDKELGDDADGITAFTESTMVPRRHFGFVQTTSLMLNGSFAGGYFFTTPYYTLALMRSKRICLALWIVSGIYSALGMTVFLEYGSALPFTGGALIYLNEVFNKPRLLATILFSFWFIMLETTGGLSKNVAGTILSLATGIDIADLDLRLLKLTGIMVQTIVCLLLYFARRATFALNSILAAYKIILMLVIFVAGMISSRESKSGWDDFNVDYPGYSAKDALSAFVYTVLAYQGYENANFVTGEIKDYKRTLKWSGITSISILTTLHVLVTLSFFVVADFKTLTTPDGQAQSAYLFAEIVFKNSKGMKVACLIAIFGQLVFTTYTYARVKQAVAWQRVIPFSHIFGRQDPYYDSPGGGLFLHWIFTVIAISGFSAPKARLMFNGIYAYGWQLMFFFLAVGLLRLGPRMREQYDTHYKPTYLKNKLILVTVAIIFASVNIVALVMESITNLPDQLPRFWWPIGAAILFSVAFVYWAILRFFQATNKWQRNIGERVGFRVHVYEDEDEVPDEMKFLMYEARLDGTRRRVDYTTSGRLNSWTASFHKFKNAVVRFLAY